MATPSVTTIVGRLGLSRKQAQEIKKALVEADRGGPKAVDTALDFANSVLEAHGVEAIRGEDHVDNFYFDINALYVNMGDTYTTTIVYDTLEERFYVMSYGDWVEMAERRGRRMV